MFRNPDVPLTLLNPDVPERLGCAAALATELGVLGSIFSSFGSAFSSALASFGELVSTDFSSFETAASAALATSSVLGAA